MPVSRRELPMTWTDHVAKWKDCTACPLSQQRFRICLGRGTVPCDVLFIGEAPGQSEDAVGQPFKGPAGDLLDQIVERSVYPPTTWAMTNLVCCFPAEAKARGDNEPTSAEIAACEPRLIEFVNIARPRLIVCVGKLSSQWIDRSDTVSCVDIDHPAYILRMPLAQKQMAVQRCIVRVRNAVEDVLAEPKVFTKWENGGHANITPKQRKRADYDRIYTGDDIPF